MIGNEELLKTIEHLRQRIAELDREREAVELSVSQLVELVNAGCGDYADAKKRAEAAEAEVKRLREAFRRIQECPDGKSKTWPEIDDIIRKASLAAQPTREESNG